MDPSLPEPLFVHQLGQRARRRRRHLEEGEEQPPQPEQPQPDITAKGQEILPLFPGYGTHYAYVYVGTPPQRQSVIIDTGMYIHILYHHYHTFIIWIYLDLSVYLLIYLTIYLSIFIYQHTSTFLPTYLIHAIQVAITLPFPVRAALNADSTPTPTGT